MQNEIHFPTVFNKYLKIIIKQNIVSNNFKVRLECRQVSYCFVLWNLLDTELHHFVIWFTMPKKRNKQYLYEINEFTTTRNMKNMYY